MSGYMCMHLLIEVASTRKLFFLRVGKCSDDLVGSDLSSRLVVRVEFTDGSSCVFCHCRVDGGGAGVWLLLCWILGVWRAGGSKYWRWRR